jgi:hypothetical protein
LDPTPYRVVEVFVGRQASTERGAALESGESEIPRLGIEPNGILSFAIAQVAVAPGAIAAIVHRPIFGMAGKLSDMGFYPQILFFLILSDLCEGEAAEYQHHHCARD